MVLGPGDFGELFGGDPGQGIRKRAEVRWKIDVWKKLARGYNEPLAVLNPLREDGDDNAEDAIRLTCSSEEMSRMYPHKANVNLQDLLLRPLTTPAAKTLMELPCKWWIDGAGVVFPVVNYGDWIMHTFGHPEGTLDGKAVIVVYAKKAEDRDIITEPLSQFIQTRNGRD